MDPPTAQGQAEETNVSRYQNGFNIHEQFGGGRQWAQNTKTALDVGTFALDFGTDAVVVILNIQPD